MNYKKGFFLLLFFLFIMGAYFLFMLKSGGNKPANLNQESTVVELPESFVSFYQKFHEDSIYQLKQIIFPLEGIPAMIDSTMDLQNFKWVKEDWTTHKVFNNHNGTYLREFDNLNGIITERIYDKSHSFEMRKRYSKMGDDWYLIYYAAMNSTMIYK